MRNVSKLALYSLNCMNMIHRKRFIKRDSPASGRRIAIAKTIGKDKGMLEKVPFTTPGQRYKSCQTASCR